MTDDEALSRDDPGAPPGFLLDDDDVKTHSHDPVEPDVEPDADADPLAQGAGEVESDGA